MIKNIGGKEIKIHVRSPRNLCDLVPKSGCLAEGCCSTSVVSKVKDMAQVGAMERSCGGEGLGGKKGWGGRSEARWHSEKITTFCFYKVSTSQKLRLS